MIRQIVLLFTILITTLASAQKDYSFDYVAEYKIYDDEYGNGLTDDHCLRYDFINSKDSSYMLYAFMRLIKKKSRLCAKDQIVGIWFTVKS